MRKLLGGLVLIAGVGGLGYVGMTQHAVRIEAAIDTQARGVAATFPHSPQVAVSGRDVTVTGRATDEAEVQSIRAALADVSGVRVVDVSGLQALPVADPYTMQITLAEGGAMAATGVVPRDAARAAFDGLDPALVDVSLAAGAPEGWVGALRIAVGALAPLQSGVVQMTGPMFSLSGVARTPAEADAARQALAGLPAPYTVTDDISTLDDGTPFRLTATMQDGDLSATGKVPAGMAPAALTERFNLTPTSPMTVAQIPSPLDGWGDAALAGLSAIAKLIEADLAIEAGTLTLTGVGSPDGIAEAEALLSGLPPVFDVTTDLSVYGADFELRLSMEWDGNAARASGTYPADFAPRGPAGVAVDDAGEVLFLPDGQGDFTANANAGAIALGLLNTGTLIATENRITLTGLASSPRVEAEMDSVLARAAPDVEIEKVINYLDDGSPAAWTLRYDAADGATLEGRLPNTLEAEVLAEALALAEVSGTPATALEDDRQGAVLETLALVAPYLPETERLTFAYEDGISSLDLVVSPGVDLDLVAIALAENLPPDVAFSVAPLLEMPTVGSLRINAATGQAQVFERGFWLPDVQFTTDLSGCTAQTEAILARDRIGFLSASARLDAASIRALNALAAVARPCVETGLTFEVGGHTDSSGNAAENEILSQDRADAVRAALIARGIPPTSLTAFGFGSSQPVAENDTAEGRAVNRRTDITWFEEGAVREP